MKAAVIFERGSMPKYSTFDEPVPSGTDEVLVKMKAVAIKHLDKARAGGSHYSTDAAPFKAKVVGGDGVGQLEDGTRVFSLGVGGTIAEKAIFRRSRLISVPDNLSDALAAALPNAIAGSAMALRFKAKIKQGDTVVINGATGFTGKLAVQLAKHYGAGHIIATGRNPDVLSSLSVLGADETVSLQQTDAELTEIFHSIHQRNPIDIVIDYVWGNSAACILASLKGDGSFTTNIRYVSVGAMSGDKIMLSSEILRSVDLQLSGSGLGSWTKAEMQALLTDIIPEIYVLAANRKIIADTETVSLEDVESLWNADVHGGKRFVIAI